MTGEVKSLAKENKMREQMKQAFIDSLKENKIPWNCDWSRMDAPKNAVTGKYYQGINSLWLSFKQFNQEYEDPRWCTYQQANEKGWRVRKGEKGTKIEFWAMYDLEQKKKLDCHEVKQLQKELGNDFYERVNPIANIYVVFNGTQIDGIPYYVVEKHDLDKELLLNTREILLKNMNLDFKEGGDNAFYRPSDDSIHMPEIFRFSSEYGYISTFFHEAGHATGHKSRLNRSVMNTFGSPEYAREELRVEIASAFTSRELGISMQDEGQFDNHKAYIQNWIEVLENEPNELFAAIKDAEKISDYLIEKSELIRKDQTRQNDLSMTLSTSITGRRKRKHAKAI